MEARDRLFPFDRVDKGSRIILYGLGVLGNLYMQQIEQLHWCDILYLMDQKGDHAAWEYPLLRIDEIGNLPEDAYDYVVIAIKSNHIAKLVACSLEKKGVKRERIVTQEYLPKKNIDADEHVCGPLKVLLYLTGGVGDGVTVLAIYERLVDLVPDVIIDIYGEPFIEFLYKFKPNVRQIFDYHKNQRRPEGYDLILQGSWWLSVLSCREDRLEKVSLELAQLVKDTEIDMKRHEPIGLRVQQARILGKDKFWLMSHGGRWGFSPELVKVDLDPAYLERFQALALKRYITINCGADMRHIELGQQPTKVWPKEYFESFISLFKRKFPDYEVIQLGAAAQERIVEADRNLLGKPFELVAYILKYSTLHIDDESGLVHLATALGTKCVGLFGPTKPDVFGYSQNINICTNVCPSCAYNVEEWNAHCIRGMEKPPCMYSITSELVLEKVSEYLRRVVERLDYGYINLWDRPSGK